MKKALIIDARYFDIAKENWGNDFDIIPTLCCLNVCDAISYHADVSLTNVGGKLVCAPFSYDYYSEKLKPYNIELIKGVLDPVCHYPGDSAYNVAVTKTSAFFKKGVIDEAVLSVIREKGIREIYVNQGYAKCSSVVADDSIITADSSIYKACEKNGVDCLKITEGEVKLFPYDYGFLGGASGFFDGVVYFFGDITMHKDYENIKDFLNKKGFKIKYIKNFPLTDIGTAFFPY